MKAAFLAYSTSLTKPVELVKLGIHQMFKNTRKKLEPLDQVDISLIEDVDFEVSSEQKLLGRI